MNAEQIEAHAKEHGHPPAAQGVVCVDFDGTIAPWGDLFGFPPPLPGAKDFLDSLRAQGYKIVIFTSRLSSVWHQSEGREPHLGIMAQVGYLTEYFQRYGLQGDSITAEKVPAMAYIDDRAVEFHDWPQSSRRFKAKMKTIAAGYVSPLREGADASK